MSRAITLTLPEVQLMFHVKHQPEQECQGNTMFHVKHDEKESTAPAEFCNANKSTTAQTMLLLAGGRAPANTWL